MKNVQKKYHSYRTLRFQKIPQEKKRFLSIQKFSKVSQMQIKKKMYALSSYPSKKKKEEKQEMRKKILKMK